MALKKPELMTQFENQLEEVFKSYEEQLNHVKGFSFNSVATVFSILVSAAPIMVPLWLQASPSERKTAVVNVANRHIDVPVIGEVPEGVLLGFIYDILILSISKG